MEYKNENDAIVQELSAIVEEKKKEISKIEKPKWLTNCAFRLSEETSQVINLNTVTDINKLVSTLATLLEKESNYTKAKELLGVEADDFNWFGYTVEEWTTDFKTRIGKINLSKKKKELAEIEAVLATKLSKELKDKLELEELRKKLLK